MYLVYTREAIAEDLGITYKKAISAFKELKENNLIIDKQCGRGMPNFIFMIKPELTAKDAKEYTDNEKIRSAKTECQDLPKSHTIKTNNIKTDKNHIDNSQSINDGMLFNKILDRCQLECFEDDIGRIFYDAIERLFYCRELKIGTSVLPGDNVRSRLCEIDYMVLENALRKLHSNKRGTKNPTGYVMSVIFNCLTEELTETHLDPYLNSFREGSD